MKELSIYIFEILKDTSNHQSWFRNGVGLCKAGISCCCLELENPKCSLQCLRLHQRCFDWESLRTEEVDEMQAQRPRQRFFSWAELRTALSAQQEHNRSLLAGTSDILSCASSLKDISAVQAIEL